VKSRTGSIVVSGACASGEGTAFKVAAASFIVGLLDQL
jgi:hypothetical protein